MSKEKKVIFITGSVRSGKSRLACEFARRSGLKVVFLATAQPLDKEMKKRISAHKRERPAGWLTVEESLDVNAVLKKRSSNEIVILDCLTLWLSNLLVAGQGISAVNARIKKIIQAIRDCRASIIIVSNEVGWGIVPENKLARDFRDIAGIANQKIAAVSDETYLCVVGVPVKVK
jgi:adenosyl cobinamide kinase/adenosyl cobinamide phosphate guanylyltransferase